MKHKVVSALVLLAGIALLSGCHQFEMLTQPVEPPPINIPLPSFSREAKPDLSDPDDGEPGQWPPQTAVERKRLYAFGAYHSWHYNLSDANLAGLSTLGRVSVKTTLRDDFDIEDAATARDMLKWLREGGFAASDSEYYGCDELFLVAQGKILPPPYMDEFGEEYVKMIYDDTADVLIDDYGYTKKELMSVDTTVAGDLDLIVTLARMCYAADYLTEEETWEYIGWAESIATSSYSTWREYMAGAVFSSVFYWMEGFYEYDVADYLIDHSNSPYRVHEFGAREGVGGRNYFGSHAEA